MKIKIVLELDVQEWEREADDCGRIYGGPGEGYRIAEAPPEVLVDFLEESIFDESHIIHDIITMVSVTRGDEEIAVKHGKIA